MKAHTLILAVALLFAGSQFAQAKVTHTSAAAPSQSDDPNSNYRAKQLDSVNTPTCPLMKGSIAGREDKTSPSLVNSKATDTGGTIN